MPPPCTGRRLGHLSSLVAYLAVFSYLSVAASVSLDLTQANRVSKIKVNPRGNLWATGHFMGKKSVFDYPDGHNGTPARLPSAPPEDHRALGTPLGRRMLELALAQEAEGRLVRYDSGAQETGLITKIIERYVKNTKI
ncbi:neuromedin Ba [Leucoraja erinacea]|uniref:neuromedin Ba n=1 Tax=Leucoraja erinaceus TaxID=7782 RepID=UPI0024538F8A|nr:neuromedin Ba [Leucoraja erinacea]